MRMADDWPVGVGLGAVAVFFNVSAPTEIGLIPAGREPACAGEELVAATRACPVVLLVAAIPIQRGQYGTLVSPRTGLGSCSPNRVQEGERRRAGPHQPHTGVGVDPVLVRNVFHG